MTNIDINFRHTWVQNIMFGSNEHYSHLRRFNIYSKGRRVGATFGAWRKIIEDAVNGKKGTYLWGDKLISDAHKYLQRDHIPFMKKHGINPEYKQQKNEIKILGILVDLRGADRPEMWEGFSYKKIFLNEAGIILKKDYLWDNSVLPMMLDYDKSQCFIFGKPYGFNKFQRLYQDAGTNENWFRSTFSTYDNPVFTKDQVDSLAQEIPAHQRQQEIYGKFIKLEDAIMNPEWIKYRDVEINQPVMAVDLAITKNDKSDFTAIVVMQKDNDGNIFIIDVERRKLSFNEIINFINEKAEKYKPIKIGIEKVQFQTAVIQEMIRTSNYNIVGMKPDADKVTRFGGLAKRYEQGLIYHSNKLPQYFEHELLNFTGNSKLDDHDDMVDAASYAFKLLDYKEQKTRWL